MSLGFSRSRIALAVTAALGAAALVAVTGAGSAGKKEGRYAAGDFHNHTTCSDGSISMQKLVKKATDKEDTPWGLDWFVQAGHGGNGNRNCTLVEDATLGTPAYPFVSGQGPTTTWANSVGAAAVKGNLGLTNASPNTPLSSQSSPNMWRWQSIQEFQYPVLEYLSALRDQPLFIGLESVVAGHEHASMSVITGQMPAGLEKARLPNSPPYLPVALGNANALAQWSYCFDRGDTDNSSGGGQNWNCMVPGSLNTADPSWNTSAGKLFPVAPNVGTKGHLKTIEALRWMASFHPDGSYYVPAHLERAGPFNPDGNNGYNIEHLRNFNNAAPDIAFGFETQPGHGASDTRGEYTVRRNGIGGVNVDTVGGTTYGGTGVYGAQIGGVWDALLGEGRAFWFFASSDWHNRGTFGPDDRRTSQDFYPGEYQRNYTLVRDDKEKLLKPQTIVDGLRSGNNFAASGQLIDRLGFVACIGDAKGDKGAKGGDKGGKSDKQVEDLAFKIARENKDIDEKDCAVMGEKLVVQPGQDIVVSIVVRDPSGTNYSPYTFPNPSLLQVGIVQPLNAPVLHHVDVIRGMITSLPKDSGTPDYAGEWPRNWITPYLTSDTPNPAPGLASVPAAAKNTSAALLKTFTGADWEAAPGNHGEFKKMTFRIPGVKASQYVRLRGTNLPRNVPFETDASGNPLPDLFTNSASINQTKSGAGDGFAANTFLRIKCTTAGTNVPANGVTYTGTSINGCPNHLPQISGQKYVAFDVAAWSDLWFYSNPIFVEVRGSLAVAGVK